MAPLARGGGGATASSRAPTVTRSAGRCCRWRATALRRIGNDTDVVTYISSYTRRRFASAFGPRAALEHVPPGVDIERFAPNEVARAELRARYRLGDRPVVVCVSRLVPRKGQDMLIRALPAIRERVARRGAGDRRRRPVPRPRCTGWPTPSGSPSTWCSPAGCPARNCPTHHAMADVFAMPCRTRGAGLDVEGLGIVYLEASATGVPVVAGRSGGAPETVLDGDTGIVVDGWDVGAIAAAVGDLLADPQRAAAMGAAGRRWAVDNWQWRAQAAAAGAAADRLAQAFCVERFDLGGELLGDDLALDLQRRRQLAGVLGEVDGQDAELADRLGLGHRLVGVLDRQVDLGDADRDRRRGRRPTRSASLPLRCFQPGKASGSIVISAAMNGLASPTAIAWLISGCARSRSSSTAGATFLPPAVTMISFLRPTIVRKPSLVDRAEVAGVEPAVGSIASLVAFSLCQ